MGDIVAAVLDAFPAPVLVVDDDVQVIGYNQAAAELMGEEPERVIRRRAGEILHCVHASEAPGGCGRAEPCQDCLVRNSVNEAVRGRRVVRQKARMDLVGRDGVTPIYLLVTTAPFIHGDKSLVMVILEDINELIELKSILPICSQCKSIRNDQEYWQRVEDYFKERLDVDFSHGLCLECAKKLYPDFYKE
jgi:PAS domain-containing protein